MQHKILLDGRKLTAETDTDSSRLTLRV